MKDLRIVKLMFLISAALFVMDVFLIGYVLYQRGVIQSASPVNLRTIPTAVTTAASDYVRAREAAIGADQPTPDAWLAAVKPLTVSTWFSQLKPVDAAGDYAVAHSNGYLVRANVGDCLWDDEAAKHTATSGTVICAVSDTTISQTSGQEVPAASLPAGWSHHGQQLPAIIGLTNQNGKWLVSNDLTGQGQ